MGDCLKGLNTLFSGLLLFLFLNIQVSCHLGKKGHGVLLHKVWGACLGALSPFLSPACWPMDSSAVG